MTKPKRIADGLLLFSALLAACAEPVPTVPTGPRDSGRTADAGAPDIDAGSADAATDAATPSDASAPTDSATPMGGCGDLVLADPVVRATAFVSSSSRPALAARDDGALVAWVGFVDGQPRLSVQHLAPDGSPSASGVADGAWRQEDPVIAATDSGYLVVWRDSRDGDVDLRARAVDAAGIASETDFVLTDNDIDDGRAAVGVTGSGSVLVAWAELGAPGHVAVLGADGRPGPAVSVPALAGLRGAPVLSSLPTGAALAWIDDASGGARVLRLGAAGQPMGAPSEIAAEGDASGGLDLTRTSSGAVLMYDVNVGGGDPQIRYQVLDDRAATMGPERVLTTSDRVGTGGSVTAFSTGFAGLYRSQSDGAAPALHLTLFEAGVDALSALDVEGLASLGGVQPIVRGSPDGLRVTAAWTDDGQVLSVQGSCE